MKNFTLFLAKADVFLKPIVNLTNIITRKKRRVFAEVDDVDICALVERKWSILVAIHYDKRFPIFDSLPLYVLNFKM